MTSNKALRSQIIRLTKSILLKPPTPDALPGMSFFVGESQSYGLSGQFSVTWWYSNDTFHAFESTAALVAKSKTDFNGCDTASVKDIIHQTLTSICVDRAVFDVNAVRASNNSNLFECRALSPDKFADFIFNKISIKLSESLSQRCTIYAIPRLMAASFSVAGRSIRLISRTDEESWQQLVSNGYVFDGWSPTNLKFGRHTDTAIFSPPGEFDCVLVSEDTGTQAGAYFNSEVKLRVLTALIYATVFERSHEPIWKSDADPYRFAIQFVHNSSKSYHFNRASIGPILPYPASEVELTQEDVSSILAWYEQLENCSQKDVDRVEKAAYFLSRAINSGGIESFLNYFISLDALLGKQGSVEKSITQGVQALGIDAKLTNKTTYLFRLRSEIVHGGSRHISEWPGYARYTSHFRSDPAEDVRDLAYSAIVRAPSHFAKSSQNRHPSWKRCIISLIRLLRALMLDLESTRREVSNQSK